MKVITEMCCAGTPDEGYNLQKCVVQTHLMKVITEMCCAGTPDEGYYRNVLCRHT